MAATAAKIPARRSLRITPSATPDDHLTVPTAVGRSLGDIYRREARSVPVLVELDRVSLQHADGLLRVLLLVTGPLFV